MHITGNDGIGNILKIFLQICFYGAIVLLIALPFILNIFGFRLGASAFIIYPNGIVLLIIAHQFIKLFDSLKKNKPFSEENVQILKTIGIVALIGAIIWLLDFLYEIILAKSPDVIFNLTLLFLSILYIGVSIALYILSALFQQATEYKKENDLTI